MLVMVYDRSFSHQLSLNPPFSFNISIVYIGVVGVAGVAFLKAVPEGTYDAIIVDSSDPIGNYNSLLFQEEHGILCCIL